MRRLPNTGPEPESSANARRSSPPERRSGSGARAATIAVAPGRATGQPPPRATLDRRSFETLRGAIVRASRTGSAETVTITVRPAAARAASEEEADRAGAMGGAAVAVEPPVAAPARVSVGGDRRGGTSPATVLRTARERGAARAAAILSGPDMLSADDFAGMLGVSRETVHQKRRRGEVLGLEGAKRGYRFPGWQVTEDGRLLPGLPAIAEALGGHAWAVFRFLVQPHETLGGTTGLEALRAGRIDEVVGLARTRDGYA